MIVVVSDLHFEEEKSDAIHGNGQHANLVFRRNLAAKAYYRFIQEMAYEAERRKVREFKLVLAGDLFDLNRTVLWFEDEIRPYVSLNDVSPDLEKKLIRIIDATAAEHPVQLALEAFRLLANGRYRVWTEEGPGEERDFPASKISLEYLAGNHDRMSNGTAGIRKCLRQLIGLRGDDEFPHALLIDEPNALIRHGQEYDRNNFSEDYSEAKTIPAEIPEERYAQPTFGDFLTIDVAVRLPYLFRKNYGDQAILEDRVLSKVYLRLLQFDDVRPQSALLDYMLDDSAGDFSSEEAWEKLVPVLKILLDEIQDDKFFQYWLKKRSKPWAPAELKTVRRLLKLGGWKNHVAREAARRLTHFFMGGELDEPELFAQREELIEQRKVRLVVAGHTHMPKVALIASDPGADRFYINTGTWRNRIPATPDRRTFGRLKALTYVMLFSGKEDPQGEGQQVGSFDYWTGFTRHWIEHEIKEQEGPTD